jgi:hypothetical protein
MTKAEGKVLEKIKELVEQGKLKPWKMKASMAKLAIEI